MTKGTSTIFEYLRSIKSIPDELNSIGYPLDDINLVLYCLSRLGPDFKDIAIVLRSQLGSFTFDQIYEPLINHELQISHEDHYLEGPALLNMFIGIF